MPKRFAVIIVVVLSLLVSWYVVSDRLAPASAQGAVNAYVTQLSSQVSGQVTRVYVADSDVVESGQPLFQLDDRVFKLAVKQAENELARFIKSTKATANGLQKNQPSNQWFEPARRIPVHIELVGGLENWPKAAKAGGKVAAVVYSSGQSNPVACYLMLFSALNQYCRIFIRALSYVCCTAFSS